MLPDFFIFDVRIKSGSGIFRAGRHFSVDAAGGAVNVKHIPRGSAEEMLIERRCRHYPKTVYPGVIFLEPGVKLDQRSR